MNSRGEPACSPYSSFPRAGVGTYSRRASVEVDSETHHLFEKVGFVPLPTLLFLVLEPRKKDELL
jgi:hypothetical protein